MHCARDRLLQILAERAADMRTTSPADRQRFVSEHVSEWRMALAQEYAGESVRISVTTEKRLLSNRSERNRRIVQMAERGVPTRSIAEREGVSLRLVQMLVRQAQVAA